MQTFRRKDVMPPGSKYFYKVPETGAWFENTSTFGGLLTALVAHYNANKLVVPANLAALVEDYMCQQMPDGFCFGAAPGKSAPHRITFFDIIRYTQALFHSKTKSDFFVSREEAESRARICLTCPLNMRHMCTTCNGLRDIAGAMIGRRETQLDAYLGVCGACGCLITAKLHANTKYLGVSEAKLQELPDNCWVKHGESKPKASS